MYVQWEQPDLKLVDLKNAEHTTVRLLATYDTNEDQINICYVR